jgi:hypothetical protein
MLISVATGILDDHDELELDLQLPMQSVHITTDVVSLNLDQGEVYNIM